MTEAERKALAELPDEVTAYRGFSRVDGERGYSWTLDLEQADWFARTWTSEHPRLRWWGVPAGEVKPCVATATYSKPEIMARLLGRDEAELLIQPGAVEGAAISIVELDR